jgi:hypothetical protein
MKGSAYLILVHLAKLALRSGASRFGIADTGGIAAPLCMEKIARALHAAVPECAAGTFQPANPGSVRILCLANRSPSQWICYRPANIWTILS